MLLLHTATYGPLFLMENEQTLNVLSHPQAHLILLFLFPSSTVLADIKFIRKKTFFQLGGINRKRERNGEK